jgi:hypothetical protein
MECECFDPGGIDVEFEELDYDYGLDMVSNDSCGASSCSDLCSNPDNDVLGAFDGLAISDDKNCCKISAPPRFNHLERALNADRLRLREQERIVDEWESIPGKKKSKKELTTALNCLTYRYLSFLSDTSADNFTEYNKSISRVPNTLQKCLIPNRDCSSLGKNAMPGIIFQLSHGEYEGDYDSYLDSLREEFGDQFVTCAQLACQGYFTIFNDHIKAFL